ncbi:CAP10 domain-containing protein [Mycena kentingensis (nom. inval.)]|nr:CAP10 domain-containing protein [Mycena kentingensis (nom. inval.)]
MSSMDLDDLEGGLEVEEGRPKRRRSHIRLDHSNLYANHNDEKRQSSTMLPDAHPRPRPLSALSSRPPCRSPAPFPHRPPKSYSAALAARAKSYLLLGPTVQEHPIPALMDAADARFRAKLSKQSTTLPAAVTEYKRRYGRPPPAGFDKWYAFAKKAGFVMIDEFDAVVEDLEAFWSITGVELRRRAELIGTLPSVDVVRIRGGRAKAVSGGKGFADSEAGARANGFKAMLSGFVKDLPDMDFTINAKAEGRVVVPWEHVAHPNLTDPNPPWPSADWAGNGSVWDSWRRTCHPSSPARRLYSSLGSGWAGAAGARDRLAEGFYAWQERLRLRGGNSKYAGAASTTSSGGLGSEFAFVRETGARSIDFCRNPGERYEQGHFFSDWRTYPLHVPIFSPGRAQGFADIRIPSHYYYGGTKRYTYAWDPINLEQRATDPMEVPWEQKRDAVWWRGASTGGGSNPPGFGSGYQRHRFLRMSSVGHVPSTGADGDRTTAVTFEVPMHLFAAEDEVEQQEGAVSSALVVPDVDPGFRSTRVQLEALNREVMDVAFVKEVVKIGNEHRIGDSVELGVGWGYKYLLDLDGMGYSGRFMAFLASDSVPLKNTMYDEFFANWIEPWVHYIPLSASYSEVYNVVSYFSGPSPSVLQAAGLPVPRTGYYGAPPAEDGWENEDRDADEAVADVDGDLAEQSKDARLALPRRASVLHPLEKRQHSPGQVALGERGRSTASGDGDRRLRRIARAGKQWKATMGRKIDMEVYVYRLAIEYARLWADDREKMNYQG